MENICIHCNANDVPLVFIAGKTIHCCYHCGTVYIQDNQLMLTVDTAIHDPLYGVARGIAEVYKQFGSMDNLPSLET